MKRLWTCLLLTLIMSETVIAAERDYPYQPVPFTDVNLTDSFWQPRIETNRTVTIPYAFGKSKETGRIENFKVAGGLSDKPWTGGFGFNDSDVSKIIEGASYCLSVKDDPKLDAYLDELIGYYAAAQEDDGYLYTLWTARDKVEANRQRVTLQRGPIVYCVEHPYVPGGQPLFSRLPISKASEYRQTDANFGEIRNFSSVSAPRLSAR